MHTTHNNKQQKMIKNSTLYLTFLLLAGMFIVSSISSAQKAVDYKLEWQYDFSGRKIDTTYWSIIERGPSAWQKFMSRNKSLYKVRNGYVRLYARQNKGLEPQDTASYLTGGICTQHKKTFTYGKIEVRARIHGATGCWPAIWIKSDNPKLWGYPERAEIDIMEYANHDKHIIQTIHNNFTDILGHANSPKSQVSPTVNVEQWNTYGVEILPDRVLMTINGDIKLEYPRIETNEVGQFPFGVESFLLIDMQVGSKYLRNIVAEEYPAWMDVDWVKVYSVDNIR